MVCGGRGKEDRSGQRGEDPVGVAFGGMAGSVFFCLGELRFWSMEMKGTIERLGDGGLLEGGESVQWQRGRLAMEKVNNRSGKEKE